MRECFIFRRIGRAATALLMSCSMLSVLVSPALALVGGTAHIASGTMQDPPGVDAALLSMTAADGRTMSGQVTDVSNTAGDIMASSQNAVSVFFSDFETGGTWDVTGSPGWGLTTYRKTTGSMSMYCAGTTIPAPGPYSPNMETWMVAGPIDLSGYSEAVLIFGLRLECEYGRDVLFAGTSTDGVNFDGMFYTGTQDSGWWYSKTVPAAGVAGSPHAYIAFAFASDESIEYEGAYIDAVSLICEPKPPTPIAHSDSYTISAGVGRTVKAPGVLANDENPGGIPLAAVQSSGASHGIATLAPTGELTYMPDPGYIGTDSFTYYVCTVESGVANVVLDVLPNVTPVAADDSYSALADQVRRVFSPGVLANDGDPYGDTLEAVLESSTTHGTVSLDASGGFTYAPEPGFTGVDSFEYHSTDGLLNSATRSVHISVVTSPPVAVHRFFNPRLGTHFYTADDVEKNRVASTLGAVYQYEGVAYLLQPAFNDTPLYRFYNRISGTHFYSASLAERDLVITTLGQTYTFEGIAYNVSSTSGGEMRPAVYRFFRPGTGTHFYTSSLAERDRVLQNLGYLYAYEGPAFYLGQ